MYEVKAYKKCARFWATLYSLLAALVRAKTPRRDFRHKGSAHSECLTAFSGFFKNKLHFDFHDKFRFTRVILSVQVSLYNGVTRWHNSDLGVKISTTFYFGCLISSQLGGSTLPKVPWPAGKWNTLFSVIICAILK